MDLHFIEAFDSVPVYYFHIKLGKYSLNEIFLKLKLMHLKILF